MARKSNDLQKAADRLMDHLETQARSSQPKEQALLKELTSDTSSAPPGALSSADTQPA